MSGLIQSAEDAFDQRLNADSDTPIALALSGGGDSMALLHLAQGWTRKRGRRLLALTVDHGLHPDSAGWTRSAGDAAKAVGADWRPLYWRGEKPKTGLPAAARHARHRLLAEAARKEGAAVILFAHTADDVAEGEIMRAADAPRLGYLQDWSPSPVWPEGRGLFILRPLLSVRRDALRDWLRTQGSKWLDDPANEDVRFARTRARAALALSERPRRPTQPCRRESLVEFAATAEHHRDGRIVVPAATFARTDGGASLRALSISVICASGVPTPPRSEALERLLARIEHDAPFVASLGGARIALEAGAVTFSREAGDMARSGLQPAPNRAGVTTVWDGRFEIDAEADVEIVPLSGLAVRLSKRDRQSMMRFPARMRPALPAIFHQGEVSLPRPFGAGPASARALAPARFAAACGIVTHERDISSSGMAQSGRSSYVEALALS